MGKVDVGSVGTVACHANFDRMTGKTDGGRVAHNAANLSPSSNPAVPGFFEPFTVPVWCLFRARWGHFWGHVSFIRIKKRRRHEGYSILCDCV